MTERQVPQIFAAHRRRLREARSAARQRCGNDAARFVWDDFEEDTVERLMFTRHQPSKSLISQCTSKTLQEYLLSLGSAVESKTEFEPEFPIADGVYDFIGVFGTLDAINDLPGALIQINRALTPGGLAIVSFVGGASLPRLRAAMLAADGDRPAARIHPMVDHRAAPQLLQRAGWKAPVVDSHRLTVRYSSLDTLVHDLRDQGLTNALSDRAPPLGKAALERARRAFMDAADPDGKVAETFEIVTLTGRRSLAGS